MLKTKDKEEIREHWKFDYIKRKLKSTTQEECWEARNLKIQEATQTVVQWVTDNPGQSIKTILAATKTTYHQYRMVEHLFLQTRNALSPQYRFVYRNDVAFEDLRRLWITPTTIAKATSKPQKPKPNLKPRTSLQLMPVFTLTRWVPGTLYNKDGVQ